MERRGCGRHALTGRNLVVEFVMGFPGAGGEDCVGPKKVEDEVVRCVGGGGRGGGEA